MRAGPPDGVLILAAALFVWAASAFAGTREESMEFAGQKRIWLAHEPAGAPKGPLPLVLVLHGGGGFPGNAEKMSGMSEFADREKFVAVYPGGTGRFARRLLTWNSGNCCGKAMKDDVDDVGFLSALIDRYVKDGTADPKRVFATGLSNGAMMAHRLACERADLVAAIAPVAGAIGVARCEPSRPVSVLMIHGRADEHVPYEGGRGKKQLSPREDHSVRENLSVWLTADACSEKPATTTKDGVTDETWTCRDGAAARLITHQGGHVWPGGRGGIRYGNVDPVVPEPKATEAIWEFFKAHPR